MKDVLTPKQVARAIGVSESSLKRWCDRGVIPTIRTAGGHRRLPIGGVLKFLRQTGQELVEPELLGLPASTGHGDRILKRGKDLLRGALVDGDEARCRQAIFDLYLAGHPLSVVFDHVIAATFHEIGDLWACGDVDVYQERRACEITMRILHEIRSTLGSVDPGWPAIGGTMSGDLYSLPTTMVEVILRDFRWRAASLGASLPVASLIAAAERIQPKLFWLSVSHIADEELFLAEYHRLSSAVNSTGAALVVGGRALHNGLRAEMQYTAYCDTMQHLQSFLKGIPAPPTVTQSTRSE